MTPRVGDRIKEWAIWDYDAAISFRDDERDILSQARYCFLDVIVYTCLVP